MKVITTLAAAALVFGVTAASAQTPSSSASKPGATENTDKEVPAKGTSRSNSLKATGGAGSAHTTGMGTSHTTGMGSMGSSHATGKTKGSNPNPTTNKNPDKEVPGKKQN